MGTRFLGHCNHLQQINVLKTEANFLKELNEHHKIEMKNTNIEHAKGKAELHKNLEAKTNELEKIENTHNILKDLYEAQHKKCFNLLRQKEALEEEIKNKERESKLKAGLCETCVYCRKYSKPKTDLQRHRTIYSKEC